MDWGVLGLVASVGLAQAAVASDVAREPLRIIDDRNLTRTVAEVRARFLATRSEVQPELTRLDIAVLLPAGRGVWRRGAFRGDHTAYPASCVKLAYLAAAMAWCRERNLPPQTVDADVRPMMAVSDNVATGRVVDRITDAPNAMEASEGGLPYDEWFRRRGYTERYLASHGLLGNQIVLNKTYPTNSGEEPDGYEERARQEHGANAMQPNLSAELVLRMVKGLLEPQANAYIRELMAHDRWKGGTVFGFGLPPGTEVLNKVGLAYDTLEDIAYIRLPNGREMVMAAYSNAFSGPEPRQPGPYYGSILGTLCGMMTERLGLLKGCPLRVIVDDVSRDCTFTGSWTVTKPIAEAFRTTMHRADSGEGRTASWRIRAPKSGRYEVCIWYAQSDDQCRTASVTVEHAGGRKTIDLDLRRTGGRWVRLGDFALAKGGGVVTVTGTGPGQLVADAVKATLWPE